VPTIRCAIACKSCLSGNKAPASRAVFNTRKNVRGVAWWVAVRRSSRRFVIDANDAEEEEEEEEEEENWGM